jgi:tagatose 1,6-diphosphate aldolase
MFGHRREIFLSVPKNLQDGPIRLVLKKTVIPDNDGELVPYYHFKIVNRSGISLGHINFRIGDTRHILLCAGHIGYGVLPKHRGHAYAYHACRALAPLVRCHYDEVIITADTDNTPSNRIIEKLGARFINQIEVPKDDPMYVPGTAPKNRYRWAP